MIIYNDFAGAILNKIILLLEKELITLEELIQDKIDAEVKHSPEIDPESEFYRLCQLIKDQKIIVIYDKQIISNFKDVLIINDDTVISFVDKERIFETTFKKL